jgi:acetolactate synthase-1/3 small subunit
LRKLINVLKVQDLTEGDFVEREMVLIRVKAPSSKRTEIFRMAEVFRARVIDMSHDNLTLEVSGSQGKIEGILDLLSPFGVQELIRTGIVAIPRAKKN